MSVRPVGVVYCINDAPHYRKMLDLSVASLRRFHADWPVEVVRLDAPARLLERVRWRFGSRASNALARLLGSSESAETRRRCHVLAQKLQVFLAPDFDRTLFIDCDTVVLRGLGDAIDRLAGDVHVVAQAPFHGAAYRAIPGVSEAGFDVVNSGVVAYTRGFIETYRGYVESCPVPAGTLPDGDQYLFSYCLSQMPARHKLLLNDLQWTNEPENQRERGLDDAETLRWIGSGDAAGAARVFHYVFRKRMYYRELARQARSRV